MQNSKKKSADNAPHRLRVQKTLIPLEKPPYNEWVQYIKDEINVLDISTQMLVNKLNRVKSR